MKNKLFILGWDNALVSDIVENKVHPAYLAMLAEVDPNLHARWTLDDTVSMQGEQPEKIWQSFCELLGDEKGRRAREIFYQTYRRLPLPPLTENALPFCGSSMRAGVSWPSFPTKRRRFSKRKSECGNWTV